MTTEKSIIEQVLKLLKEDKQVNHRTDRLITGSHVIRAIELTENLARADERAKCEKEFVPIIESKTHDNVKYKRIIDNLNQKIAECEKEIEFKENRISDLLVERDKGIWREKVFSEGFRAGSEEKVQLKGFTPAEIELLVLHDLPTMQRKDYDLNWKSRREIRENLLKKLSDLT